MTHEGVSARKLGVGGWGQNDTVTAGKGTVT